MALVSPEGKEERHRNNKCLLESQLCQPSDLLASFLSLFLNKTPIWVWLRVRESGREMAKGDSGSHSANEGHAQRVGGRGRVKGGDSVRECSG